LEFDPGEVSPVLEVLAWIGAHRDGWVNLLPGVDQTDEPVEGPGLFSMFGTRQAPVAMCTWMPPGRSRRSPEEVTVGIMHPAGRRVLPELVAAGLGVPPGWRVTADHPRRGLVVMVPATVPNEQVLAWTLAAGAKLCALPTTGRWRAEVYLPAG
jgi:hypothetical protein